MRRSTWPARTIGVLGILAGLSAHAAPIEVAGQSVVTLASDRQTKGGGAGLGVEVGIPVAREPWGTKSTLLMRGRLCGLVGAGLAWSAEAGIDLRWGRFHRYEPELGLHGLLLGGDLIRAIDNAGHLAGDPFALMLGLAPLRFRLDEGWISILGVRAGPTLFRSGSPPFVLSITLLEIGRSL